MAKSYTSRPEGMTSVRLDLDGDRHVALRVLAAQSGVPMSRLARSIVEAHLDTAAGVAKKQHPGPRKKS